MATQAALAGAKGRNRPTRQAAQQHRYADMKVEGNGYAYDDEPYAHTNGSAGELAEPAHRVDLTRMKVQALRKYTKVYEVSGVHPQSTKEDLTAAVSKHWNATAVSEEAVLQNCIRMRSRSAY